MNSGIISVFLLASLNLFAQTPETTNAAKTFVGVWDLVSVKSIAADSTISYPYGEHPVGNMFLTADGDYSVQIYAPGRTKIASGNKNTATPDENIMMVKGSNAHYGKYEVNEKITAIIFKPEHAFFPNWEGQELKQNFVLKGDVLTYSSGVSTFGAAKSVVVWKKR